MGVILETSLILIMRLLDSYIRILAVNCSIWLLNSNCYKFSLDLPTLQHLYKQITKIFLRIKVLTPFPNNISTKPLTNQRIGEPPETLHKHDNIVVQSHNARRHANISICNQTTLRFKYSDAIRVHFYYLQAHPHRSVVYYHE